MAGRSALLAIPGAWVNEHFDSGQQVFNVMHGSHPAQGDGRATDRQAIQYWLDYATRLGGGTVYLPPGTYDLGTTGLTIDSSAVGLRGATSKASVLRYTGSGAALTINSGGGVTTEHPSFGHFGVDCRNAAGTATGAVGIQIGHGTATSPQAAAALFESIRVVYATTAGWDLKGAQECVFLDCWGENNTGDGMRVDCGYTGSGPTFAALNANTQCTFIGGMFGFNGGRGLNMRQASNFRFLGTIFQSNSLEGVRLLKPDPTIYLNTASFHVDFHGCYLEVNNKNRASGGGPYYQMLIDNENGAAGAVWFGVNVEDANFGTPNTGSHTANSHIGLGYGGLRVARSRYTGYTGGTATGNVVAFRNSSGAVLDVSEDANLDPSVASPSTASPAAVGLAGASVAFTGESTYNGARSWWTNASGVVTMRASIPPGGKFTLGGGDGVADIVTAVDATVVVGTVPANDRVLAEIDVPGAGAGNQVSVGLPPAPAGIIVGQPYAITDKVICPYYNVTGSPIVVGTLTCRGTVTHF